MHSLPAPHVEWTHGAGDEGGTGRRVRFDVEAVVAGVPLPRRAGEVERYRRNPALT